MRLAALATTFSNNVLDETKAFGHVLTDPRQVQGVPVSAKEMALDNGFRLVCCMIPSYSFSPLGLCFNGLLVITFRGPFYAFNDLVYRCLTEFSVFKLKQKIQLC